MNVMYANDGRYTFIRGERETDHLPIYTTAMGRNGTCEVKGLEVFDGDKYVSLTPITRKKGVLMNCRIEVPKDSASLGKLIEVLTAIHDSIVDKELMA